MYAIVRTGGKQYRVEPGTVVRFDGMEAALGTEVTLDDVLLVGDGGVSQVGAPRVAGASVVGTVVSHDRAAKVRVFKYKKRKHYRRTRGHRQSFTAVRIDKVQA
jgi:large subunit ribosomal protein L21